MQVAIEIPDDVSTPLRQKWGDIERHALAAVAVEAYRSGALTTWQVGRMLGHTSRWETEAFLRGAQAWSQYSEDDLDRDLASIRPASPP